MKKRAEITVMENQRVEAVNAILNAKRNELALLEVGMKGLIDELANKYQLYPNATYELTNGKLIVQEVPDGDRATSRNKQKKQPEPLATT